MFVWSDNTSWDIHPFRVRFEIQTTVTVVTDIASRSSSRLKPLTGVQAFDADDEHDIVNIEGDPFKITRRTHAGHGKTVATEQLTHSLFRGFFDRVNDVQNPMADQFVYVLGPQGVGGGFEKYSDSGVTGFYPGYDPFADGEPWHTAEVATGIDYVGDFTYRGHTHNEASLERVATAAGEVFTLLEERRVVFVDEFTAATSGYTVFTQERVVPRYFNNPELILWGAGQDTRIADETLVATGNFGIVVGTSSSLQVEVGRLGDSLRGRGRHGRDRRGARTPLPMPTVMRTSPRKWSRSTEAVSG